MSVFGERNGPKRVQQRRQKQTPALGHTQPQRSENGLGRGGCLLCFVSHSTGSVRRCLGAELYGSIFVGNVTLQFGAELRGRVFKESMTVEFGRVRQSSVGELCGSIFVENVTLQFGAELCGSIFVENVTL